MFSPFLPISDPHSFSRSGSTRKPVRWTSRTWSSTLWTCETPPPSPWGSKSSPPSPRIPIPIPPWRKRELATPSQALTGSHSAARAKVTLEIKVSQNPFPLCFTIKSFFHNFLGQLLTPYHIVPLSQVKNHLSFFFQNSCSGFSTVLYY